MTPKAPLAAIPVAWLKPIPDGYRIPMWRWLLLPATALMLKRSGGVWVNGTLQLTPTDLAFVPSRGLKSARQAADAWSIPLDTISRVTFAKGVLSETLEMHHAGGKARVMTARSADFIAQLQRFVTVI